MNKRNVLVVLKVVILQIIVTVIASLIGALIAYKFNLSEGMYRVLVVAVYIIATFTGGRVIGKIKAKKKYLWGMLTGLLYIAIIALISFIVKGTVDCSEAQIMVVTVGSILGGTIGGMTG